MDRYEFQGYDIFMLFAVHHPPYNITMLFIESSNDGECFTVGPGLLYLLLLLFRFFIMNFVLRVRCFSVYSALYLSFLYLVKRNTVVTRSVPQIPRQQ
jgi:hypothetical protein